MPLDKASLSCKQAAPARLLHMADDLRTFVGTASVQIAEAKRRVWDASASKLVLAFGGELIAVGPGGEHSLLKLLNVLPALMRRAVAGLKAQEAARQAERAWEEKVPTSEHVSEVRTATKVSRDSASQASARSRASEYSA